ncbi:pilin [Alcaligenes faecalis]|jgi:type IV pilus assembly protein PilA|uniref:pilin n=1 Tax=Alcaligenes faecalis TaxID=511 RepID=UPI0034D5EC56
MKYKNKKGFTLIETIITVSILGIVSAFSIQAYQDYVIKSQVSEAFVAAEGIKKEIESQKALTDKFDINLVKINSSSMRVDDEGNVFYTFKDKNKNIDNKVVMFYLDENSINKNTFIWNCISDLDKKYLPSSIECFIDDQKTDNPSSENDKEIVRADYHLYVNINDDDVFLFRRILINENNTELYEIEVDMNNNTISLKHKKSDKIYNSDIGIKDYKDFDKFKDIENSEIAFQYQFSNQNELNDILFNNKKIEGKSIKGLISELSSRDKDEIRDLLDY